MFMFPRDYVILLSFIVFIYMGFASVVPSRNTAYRISSHSWSFFPLLLGLLRSFYLLRAMKDRNKNLRETNP